MINVLPIQKVIWAIALTYAFASALLFGLIYANTGEQFSAWQAATFSLSGSFVLQLALFAWIHVVWRWLWRTFPVLGRLIYPDISGRWEMKIKYAGLLNNQHGEVLATAIIKQNFLHISMDVVSPGSHSQTLVAIPQKQSPSNQPLLYYTYLVTTEPANGKPSKTYRGAAILEFGRAGNEELVGNYWTSAHTSGVFQLSKRNSLSA